MTTAVTATPLPTTNASLVFATGLPLIGTVDFNNKMEWVYAGGIVVALFAVQNNLTKALIIAGILAVRYEMGKAGTA